MAKLNFHHHYSRLLHVTWSFANHSDMPTCCSRKPCPIIINVRI